MLNVSIVEACIWLICPAFRGMELAPYSDFCKPACRLSRLHWAISLSLSW